MAIALTLRQYLVDNQVNYDVLTHAHTQTSTETAQASHIPGDRVAKAVLLKRDGDYMLAVLPASRHIAFDELRDALNGPLDMASEEEVCELFADCVIGAVPPVGSAYGLNVVMDERLADQSEIYMEGGDHRSLIHLSGSDFRRLMKGSRRESFSAHL